MQSPAPQIQFIMHFEINDFFSEMRYYTTMTIAGLNRFLSVSYKYYHAPVLSFF